MQWVPKDIRNTTQYKGYILGVSDASMQATQYHKSVSSYIQFPHSIEIGHSCIAHICVNECIHEHAHVCI
mgnify:CR=1 FL=1